MFEYYVRSSKDTSMVSGKHMVVKGEAKSSVHYTPLAQMVEPWMR